MPALLKTVMFGVLLIPWMAFAEDAKVNVYGKAHVSIDAVNDGENDDSNISSNSSRIGFQGSKDLIRDLTAIWKFESTIHADGETGSLSARNRYAGIKGALGTILVGIHDTPMKSVARRVDVFNETVADNRNILGVPSDGSGDNNRQFNIRAKNALAYESPKVNGIQFIALHSTDFTGDDVGQVADKELNSVSLSYDQGPLMLAGAYEDRWANDGFRLVARVKSETAFASFIFESLSSRDGEEQIDRNAYSFNGAYHIGLVSLAIQYAVADDNETAAEDSGASMVALGVFQALSKNTRAYFVAANMNNGASSNFGLGGGGHGDSVTPFGFGEELTAFSLGMIHTF